MTEPLRRCPAADGDPPSRPPPCRHDHRSRAWNALVRAPVTAGRVPTRPACRGTGPPGPLTCRAVRTAETRPVTDRGAPAADRTDTRLCRAVTGPLLFLFILGDVLGAGVYTLAGRVAAEVGGAIRVPLLVALLLALLTAASYAEPATE